MGPVVKEDGVKALERREGGGNWVRLVDGVDAAGCWEEEGFFLR